MEGLDASKLVADMIASAKGSLRSKWPEVKDVAETEFKKLGDVVVSIQQQRLSGKMTAEQARITLDVQKQYARMAFSSVKGLSTLVSETALRAALSIIWNRLGNLLGAGPAD